MLCQFTFSNYRSYRDETTFSLQATSMKEFSRSLLAGSDGQSFLPVAAVYGPNAGGKSNLIDALMYVCSAIARPIAVLKSGEGPVDAMSRIRRCAPFAFQEDAVEPSRFEVYFRVGEHEYRYSLEVNCSEIVGEGLSRRKIGASRTALLFERTGDEIELGPSLRRAGISTSFNPSIPYLSYLRMNTDHPAITAAADWFVGSTFLNYNNSFLENYLEQMLDQEDSEGIVRLLKAVDVHVDGFRVERDEEGPREGQKVFVKHHVHGRDYELRLREESAGTQKLMGLAGFLLPALERGSLVVIDELDAKLHPKLLRYVILLFKDPEVNRNGAQLVFSSQDVSTMRNDVFRRDEIWFAARDNDEASQLWSLSDVRERNGKLVSKSAAFDKQYLAGRYGADPYLERMRDWV